MLELALDECKKLKFHEVLIQCPSENYGSAKVIENNYGIMYQQNKSKYYKILLNNKLYLQVPTYDTLHFREEYLQDNDTMSYNAGYDSKDESYNYRTGTISFHKKKWDRWLSNWLNSDSKYFAYLFRKDNHEIIGNIAFHYDNELNNHIIEIIIVAKHREKGYAKEGLELLCEIAFYKYGINALVNLIPEERIAAIKAHKSIGFKSKEIVKGIKFKKVNNSILLVLKKDEYKIKY